jgi:hypothetical protein
MGPSMGTGIEADVEIAAAAAVEAEEGKQTTRRLFVGHVISFVFCVVGLVNDNDNDEKYKNK